MKTAIFVIIAIICTWFATTKLSIEMPFVPEVTIEIPEQAEIPKITIEPPTEKETPLPPSVHIENLEYRIFELINRERIDNRLHSLTWSDYWHKLAQRHSEEMSATGEFEHSELNCFENIFQGIGYDHSVIPEITIETWMGSPGHKANLLEKRVHTCGIGIAMINNIAYVTYMAD